MSDEIPLKKKLHAFYMIAAFRPKFTAMIVLFGLLTAVLEGVGVTFIIPLVEIAQSPGATPEGGLVGFFATAYDLIGVPFTLAYIVIGVSAVLTVRYISTFLAAWAQAHLRVNYVRDIQSRAFENALNARTEYFDSEGSDDILNAIVTQGEKAGYAIEGFVRLFQILLLVAMYMLVALYLAPVLTSISTILVALFIIFLRNNMEGAYSIGDRVAEANENLQRAAQAGTQGIREVKMLRYDQQILKRFHEAMTQFVDSSVKMKRNEALIRNGHNLAIAVLIFVLIYVSLRLTNMSFGALGAFLFVMFKLGPMVSGGNKRFYQLEGMLPHLVRTEEFINELQEHTETESGDEPVPEDPTPVEFDSVSFQYSEGPQVLKEISFNIEHGEFVAFVGESGAGKSTIASLIARLYAPDDGEIYAAKTPIQEYNVREWRSQIAYVRQNPFIFNTTLKRNIMMANPRASREELERVSEIAQITEFLDDLPDGYDTELGDDGVRLSGGQRQRVALARALIEDAAILLLDEATSDLDANIENRVHRGIETMDRDVTIIAIAHQLSTVSDADQILTLQDGEIIEKGEHDTLLNEGGAYAELYSAQ